MTDNPFPPNRIRPRPGLPGGFPPGVADKDRLAEIMRLRSGGMSFRKIGKRLDISGARVHKILDKAKAG